MSAAVEQLYAPVELGTSKFVANFDAYAGETPANQIYSYAGMTLGNFGDSPVPVYNWGAIWRQTSSPSMVVATVSDWIPSLGIGSQFSTFLDFNFASGVSEVGAFFGNDFSDGLISMQYLSAFDSSGNILGTVSVTPNMNTSVDQFIGLRSATPIYRARFFTNEQYGRSVVLDDVMFTAAVPEPETYAVMLAGLGLLGVMARRRKQNLSSRYTVTL